MIRDADGYAGTLPSPTFPFGFLTNPIPVIEVIENNLRSYYNEITKDTGERGLLGHDIILLYEIAEALILFLLSEEDYHYTQVDDGDRVERITNLIACMVLDLVWRLHIYKDCFGPRTPFKSLPLIMGVAVQQLGSFDWVIDGGNRVDEEDPDAVDTSHLDAADLIKGLCRKANVPLYTLEQDGVHVLENEPEEGDEEMNQDWINVDFEQEVSLAEPYMSLLAGTRTNWVYE